MTQTEEAWDYDSAARAPRWREELEALSRSVPLIRELTSRDLKVRYSRSWLGVVWSMVLPISMLGVLTFVFSDVLAPRGGSYPRYLFPGLVLWTFFAQASAALASSVQGNADLFRRVRIARTAPAVATVASGLVHLCAGTAACVVVMLLTGARVTVALLTVPAGIALVAAFTLGVGLLLAAMSVDLPDLPSLYQTFLPVLMFVSPVVYPPEVLPPVAKAILRWNPFAAILEIFRRPFSEGQAAPLTSFVIALVAATGACLAGWLAYTRKIDDIAYRG